MPQVTPRAMIGPRGLAALSSHFCKAREQSETCGSHPLWVDIRARILHVRHIRDSEARAVMEPIEDQIRAEFRGAIAVIVLLSAVLAAFE